jgi:hypothetical protein
VRVHDSETVLLDKPWVDAGARGLQIAEGIDDFARG